VCLYGKRKKGGCSRASLYGIKVWAKGWVKEEEGGKKKKKKKQKKKKVGKG
jgi:hypothetical protein